MADVISKPIYLRGIHSLLSLVALLSFTIMSNTKLHYQNPAFATCSRPRCYLMQRAPQNKKDTCRGQEDTYVYWVYTWSGALGFFRSTRRCLVSTAVGNNATLMHTGTTDYVNRPCSTVSGWAT